jgi:hypothetical protein
MRVGLSISAVGHGALLIWAVVGLPGASSHQLDRQQPLPIDVISMEEYTRITAGVRDGEDEAETAAAEPDDLPEAERTPDNPEVREQTAAPEPEPPPPPQARPEPEPEPEPQEVQTAAIPPEPTPEPEPAEAESEPEPAPRLSDAPLPRSRPDMPAPQPEPEPEPVPRPAEPERPASDFDPDRIAALINRTPVSGGGTVQGQAEEGESPGRGMPSGRDDRLSMSEIDALRRQIARCWNPPISVRDAQDLIVRVAIELNPDGSLSATPRVLGGTSHPSFNVAAEEATRAVSRCEPYRLPAEKYDLWQEIHINFDPREMLGG